MGTDAKGKQNSHDSDPNQEYYRLWVLLRQVGHLMTELRRADLLACGMSPAQAATLRSTAKLGEMATPAEISRWLMRKPHTITHLLNRMEKCGQIKKVKDLKRKNQIRIALTKKGEQDYDSIRKVEYPHPILGFLSGQEKETLELCLNKIRTRLLEELKINYRPPLFDDLNIDRKKKK
ncbi:MAG: winged helix-turn-helix transcriptional regulator [Syntrophaceae bacterium]|nr:winged helix-turn-helix transcriptional regulator [Syntrophaceae bacterium]